jgi:two-component SAPR family response regulator
MAMKAELVGGVLNGVGVLIVEDEYLIAQEVAEILRLQGATVLGPVAEAAGARRLLAEKRPDCALLDINLRGKLVFEFAAELQRLSIPAVLITGYDRSIIPAAFRHLPSLQKPVNSHRLITSICKQARAFPRVVEPMSPR